MLRKFIFVRNHVLAVKHITKIRWSPTLKLFGYELLSDRYEIYTTTPNTFGFMFPHVGFISTSNSISVEKGDHPIDYELVKDFVRELKDSDKNNGHI